MPFPPKSNDPAAAADVPAFGKKAAKKRFGKKQRKAAPIQKSMMQGSGRSQSRGGGRY
jgi:hypothetical protein